MTAVSINEVNSILKTLPESLFQDVIQYVEFLSYKNNFNKVDLTYPIPEWHRELISQRLDNYKNNPNNVTDFNSFCDELEKELV